MQGEERMDRQLLDTEMLAGHLVPRGSMFAFLAAHRGEVFPDEDFADLFPSGRGRPSIPATVMAAVIALQTLHDYSDRETAGAVRFDARWKVACGLAVDDEGFDAPRWCTGGGGSPSQSARTGSTTRSGRSWRRPGSSRARGGGWGKPRSWRTRPVSVVVCR